MKYIATLGIGIIVILSGYMLFSYIMSNNPSSMSSGQTVKKEIKPRTSEEVASHSNPQDCWLIIHGKVYDVSGWSGHPGSMVIFEACGKDATTQFETRPSGSKTPHSKTARELMSLYYIGDITNVQ